MWPVLHRIPPVDHPDLIIGLNQADDSGVVRIGPDRAIILSVDFFPAIVDDPYDFGQVAAANALSDIYAMGGKPLSALNIIAFPSGTLPIEALELLMRGGSDKVAEAGAVIVGGHTLTDSEIKYGLSVVGTIDPGKLIRISGAKPGDALVLTKPLGTGVYSTALKMERLTAGEEREFTDVMKMLNAGAAEPLHRLGANSCTDVTGFGLAGHASEMAEDSNVTLEIDLGSVPVLSRAVELAAEGMWTGGGRANIDYSAGRVRVEGDPPKELAKIVFDPQTSGGLLVSLPAGNAEEYVSAVRKAGAEMCGVIGRVVPASDVPVVVRG